MLRGARVDPVPNDHIEELNRAFATLGEDRCLED